LHVGLDAFGFIDPFSANDTRRLLLYRIYILDAEPVAWQVTHNLLSSSSTTTNVHNLVILRLMEPVFEVSGVPDE
jgi:hypothetical protein